MQPFDARIAPEIQGNAAFALVGEQENPTPFRVWRLAGKWTAPPRRITRKRFNLNDVSAEFGQQLCTGRSRDHLPPFNDTNALQRSRGQTGRSRR